MTIADVRQRCMLYQKRCLEEVDQRQEYEREIISVHFRSEENFLQKFKTPIPRLSCSMRHINPVEYAPNLISSQSFQNECESQCWNETAGF
mmetsp:Transcript_53393/g.61195  ORF Transcript_53393/g.61195 Transcript_53393/m.61195 type:complete len:91 (-) Transcript_53393:448-720(-)